LIIQPAVAEACFELIQSLPAWIVSGDILMPTRCGNGQELTPDNLVHAERDTHTDWTETDRSLS
jgi:hypothetical protein